MILSISLHTRKKCWGFTLIELLVVIAIIALLLSVMMSSLQKAKQYAKRIVCTTNQHGIAVASIAYMGDNRNTFMFQHAGTDYAQPNALTSGVPNWITRVWPYIGGKKEAFRCPANKWRHEDTDDPSSLVFKPTAEEEFSYVANGVITYYGKLQRTPPASIVAFFDDYDAQNGATVRPHYSGTMQPSKVIPIDANGWVGWMRYSNGLKLSGSPHNGRVNAFFDGSANWYEEDALTSRKYGLLINGLDTYEPESGSYADSSRWGVVVVR